MQAGGSQKWEDKCMADRGQDLSALEAEEARGESPEGETHAIMDNSLFQPIQHDTRNKYETIFWDCSTLHFQNYLSALAAAPFYNNFT